MLLLMHKAHGGAQAPTSSGRCRDIAHKSDTINYQLPTTNNQLPTTNIYQLPTTNYQTTNYQLPTTNYQLPTTNYQLPTTNNQLPTINHQETTSYQLPTTNYQLSTTNYYQLPTNYQLPTTGKAVRLSSRYQVRLTNSGLPGTARKSRYFGAMCWYSRGLSRFFFSHFQRCDHFAGVTQHHSHTDNEHPSTRLLIEQWRRNS